MWQAAEQVRRLRGAECECPQLLEHAGMQGKVGLAFQAHSPAGPAQVHDAQPRHLIEAEHRQRPGPGGGVRPAAERQDLHGHRAAVTADPGQQAELPFHDLGGSSRYLYDQVKALGIPERDLAWANARDRNGRPNDLGEAVEAMPNLKRVVALGQVAMKVCDYDFGKYDTYIHGVPHPQYWKRFHAGHETTYQEKLKEAMGL